jgi:spectrin beta
MSNVKLIFLIFSCTDAIDQCKNNQSQWEKAQQYLFDANEAEAWMSEQELYMMVEDRGKDEISAQNLMKKHEILEQAVDDYAQTIRQLGETVRQLTAEEHPLRYSHSFVTFELLKNT